MKLYGLVFLSVRPVCFFSACVLELSSRKNQPFSISFFLSEKQRKTDYIKYNVNKKCKELSKISLLCSFGIFQSYQFPSWTLDRPATYESLNCLFYSNSTLFRLSCSFSSLSLTVEDFVSGL